MISLPVGTRMVKSYDAEMSKVGRGVLYLLSNGILFEKKGGGVRFECNFEYLASFEAVKKDKLLLVIRTPEGRKSVELKVGLARGVEDDIARINQEYADPGNQEKMQEGFDQDAHSLSEARFFQENWDTITKFLKPERTSYLNEYVKTAKVGSPNVDPYLLVVDYENLTYNDFADLPGFLKMRYPDITDKEVDMMVGVFRDFDIFSIDKLEMEIQLCRPLEQKFKKDGYELFQFVAIVAREKLEKRKSRKIQSQTTNN